MGSGRNGQGGVHFDAFLSYSWRDAALVEHVARALRETDPPLTPFLDRWHLAAGQSWPQLLEERLADCRAAVVFIGPEGLGTWQQREQYVALDRQSRDPGFAVIPVLLPGADDPALGFLKLNTWVDLRGRAKDPAAVAELARAIRGEPPGASAARPDPRAEICPYRGLQPFREEDAPFFFGRDAFAERLVEATRRHAFFAVVGASGSGKSSVVRAGLVPRLRRGEDGRVWDVLTLVPGARPLTSLFAAFETPPAELGPIQRNDWLEKKTTILRRDGFDLASIVDDHLALQPGTERLLLVVDQWEELYT